jgi:tripeptidyl-peptidase-1
MTHGGGWMTVTGVPVSRADELLGASYQLYRHTSTNDTILRTVGYSLPAALHAHVQTVAPTTYFAPPLTTLQQTPRKLSREEASAIANASATFGGEPVTVRSKRVSYVYPDFLRWLYKTNYYVPTATDQNVLGIVGFNHQFPSLADLGTFVTRFRTDAKTTGYTVVDVNDGGYDPSDPGSEANQNVQYSEALTYPVPHIYYSVGGNMQAFPLPGAGDSYLQWFKHILSL